MKKYFILTISLALIMASCGKKPVDTAGREDMLRTGKWSVSAGTITMKLPDGRDTILDYMNFLPMCHRDDYLVFHGGVDAALFSGSFTCSPSDPDSATFKWSFSNSEKNLSLYNGFDFIWSANEVILPFVFDTCLSNGGWGQPYLFPGISPCSPLAVDTLHGVNDTLPGFTRTLIVLDTFWNLRFDTTALNHPNLYNTAITAFSQSSFTINFSILGTRPDSLNHHTNQLIYLNTITGLMDTLDKNPIIRQDTFKYSLTFRNF